MRYNEPRQYGKTRGNGSGTERIHQNIYENIADRDQCEIHSFQFGSLQSEGQCRILEGWGGDRRIYHQSSSGGYPCRYLQAKTGRGSFFLLYLEHGICTVTLEGSEKGSAGHGDLAGRSGGLVWLWRGSGAGTECPGNYDRRRWDDFSGTSVLVSRRSKTLGHPGTGLPWWRGKVLSYRHPGIRKTGWSSLCLWRYDKISEPDHLLWKQQRLPFFLQLLSFFYWQEGALPKSSSCEKGIGIFSGTSGSTGEICGPDL